MSENSEKSSLKQAVKVNKQELNKTLAEWAGFDLHYNQHLKRPRWQASNGDWDIDFTKSLDACFKWLVPKLVSVNIKTWDSEPQASEVIIWAKCDTIVGDIASTPALALCLAIEKLVDSLNKNKEV